MSKGFYRRLAWQNLGKNRQFYLPYLLSGAVATAMYFILTNLSKNDGIGAVKGGTSMLTLLDLGRLVAGLLALLLLLYANSFLMKRRNREFGLYAVLGLEKRHIARVIAWESCYSAGIVLSGGLILGLILNQLTFLLLMQIMHQPPAFSLSFSPLAFRETVLLFLLLFGVQLAFNLVRVLRSNPIQLFQAAHAGEREPKANWLIGLFGLVTLGVGYGLALTIQSPVQALSLFIVAIVLVMLGTYALFTAGSILLLRLLRKNKAFYYKANHFVSVSGMFYRMKQNAAGLASICILSTGVLLMLSSSACLYFGVNDVVSARFASDVRFNSANASDALVDEANQIIDSLAQKYDVTVTDFQSLRIQNLRYSADTNILTGDTVIQSYYAIPLSEYNRLSGRSVTLKPGEILLWDESGQWSGGPFTYNGQSLTVKEALTELPFDPAERDRRQTDNEGSSLEVLCLVLPTEEDILALDADNPFRDPDSKDTRVSYQCSFNLKGNRQAMIDFSVQARADIMALGRTSIDARYESLESYYVDFGGMLFLGLFLGLLFLLATALIIYYKQMAEGYEDRERFAILQKVGMRWKEIHQSTQSQILMVFFLPLGMAVLHMLAAFPLVCKVLRLLSMNNVNLFALCLAGAVLLFALVYGLVYHLTAQVYERIVIDRPAQQ